MPTSKWTRCTNYPLAIQNARAGACGDFIYVAGGNGISDYVDNVYGAKVYPNGTLGDWVALPKLPAACNSAFVVSDGQHLYIVGGRNGVDGADGLDTVLYARPDANGNVAKWKTSYLPTGLAPGLVFIKAGFMYVVGGFSSGGNVYRASLNTDGGLGPWKTVGQLPVDGHDQGSYAYTNDFLIIKDPNAPALWTCPIGSGASFTKWKKSGFVNDAIGGALVGRGDHIYSMSGYSPNTNDEYTDIFATKIKHNGTVDITTWTSVYEFPDGGYDEYAFTLHGDRFFFISGEDADVVNQVNVYSALFRANGSLQAF